MEMTRPIAITRMMVMEAYRRVKTNRASPGVDGESQKRLRDTFQNPKPHN